MVGYNQLHSNTFCSAVGLQHQYLKDYLEPLNETIRKNIPASCREVLISVEKKKFLKGLIKNKSF